METGEIYSEYQKVIIIVVVQRIDKSQLGSGKIDL